MKGWYLTSHRHFFSDPKVPGTYWNNAQSFDTAIGFTPGFTECYVYAATSARTIMLAALSYPRDAK